jgi:hypothetical protein
MVQYMSVPPPKDPMEEKFFISCTHEDENRTCIRIVAFFSIRN